MNEFVLKNNKTTNNKRTDYLRNWRKNHPAYFVLYRAQIRREVIEIMGGKCQRCGFADIRCLQVDHIHGRGFLENRHNWSMYLRIRNMQPYQISEKYQLLCANCNWIKRVENGEVRKRK